LAALAGTFFAAGFIRETFFGDALAVFVLLVAFFVLATGFFFAVFFATFFFETFFFEAFFFATFFLLAFFFATGFFLLIFFFEAFFAAGFFRETAGFFRETDFFLGDAFFLLTVRFLPAAFLRLDALRVVAFLAAINDSCRIEKRPELYIDGRNMEASIGRLFADFQVQKRLRGPGPFCQWLCTPAARAGRPGNGARTNAEIGL